MTLEVKKIGSSGDWVDRMYEGEVLSVISRA